MFYYSQNAAVAGLGVTASGMSGCLYSPPLAPPVCVVSKVELWIPAAEEPLYHRLWSYVLVHTPVRTPAATPTAPALHPSPASSQNEDRPSSNPLRAVSSLC